MGRYKKDEGGAAVKAAPPVLFYTVCVLRLCVEKSSFDVLLLRDEFQFQKVSERLFNILV